MVWWILTEVCSNCDLFSQEPGSNKHHGSAPQISVTESSPDRNRKVLLVPANQLQVPSQGENSVKVNSILLWNFGCSNCRFLVLLLNLLILNRQNYLMSNRGSWILSAMASVDAWMTSAVPWILARVLPAPPNTQIESPQV